MKSRTTLLVIGIVLASLMGVYVYQNYLKTGPSMSKRQAVYTLTAIELYSQFEADELKANELYLNQIIEVIGVVESVELPDDSNPILSLQTEGFGLVKATMESPNELAASEDLTGKEVTLKGECIGILLDVLLNQSIIINQE